MVRIQIEALWHFTSETSPHSMRVILSILREIKQTGTLASAAEHSGMSYRHAWNLVDQWSAFFGEPLVERHRGKGTHLTALGSKLVWAEQHLNARLGPQLQSADDFGQLVHRFAASALLVGLVVEMLVGLGGEEVARFYQGVGR